MTIRKNSQIRVGIALSATSDISLGVIVRIRELARSLVNKGIEVHIIGPADDNLERLSGIFTHRIGKHFHRLKYVKVASKLANLSLRNPVICRDLILRPSTVERAIDSFSQDLYVAVKDLNLDILQGEQEVAAAASPRVAEKLGIPAVASLHTIYHEEQRDASIINERDAAYCYIDRLLHKTILNSSLTLVLSQGVKDYFVKKHAIPEEKIAVVPLSAKPRIVEAEYEQCPSKIVHAGLLSRLDSVHLFVKSVPIVKIRHPLARVYLTKKGECLGEIKTLERKQKIGLNYFWFAAANDFYSFLKSCHIGVVTSQNCLTRRVGFTMKFFDYMACGVPVVANDIGGWTSIIKERKVGVLTESNPKDFAEGTNRLLEDPELRYKCAQNSLNLVKTEYDIDKIALRLSERYDQLLTHK